MDQYNWEQLTSQQALAAMAQAAMEQSPDSRKKIEEVVQVLSGTLTNGQGKAPDVHQQQNGAGRSSDLSYRNDADHAPHYQHVFERSPQSLIVTDAEGVIQDLNSAAIALLGHSSETHHMPSRLTPTVNRSTLVGQFLGSFVSPEYAKTFSNYFKNICDDVQQGSSSNSSPAQSIRVLIDPLIGPQQLVCMAAQSISDVSNTANASPMMSWVVTDMKESRQIESALQQQIQETHQRYVEVQQANQALAETVQAKNSQVEKATEFESALKRITDRVRDSLDESKILQTVVKELSIVLRLGGCNTALYDLEKGTSTISYEYTNFISAYRGKVAQMDNFPEIYNQLKQGHYFQFCSLIPNPERGHVSLLACPIFMDAETEEKELKSSQSYGVEATGLSDPPGAHGKVLGDLWLIDRKEHVFNEYEIRLVQQVANQCAIAIRQARLYKAAQAQVHELEKLNRLKDEFLSTVSHELRTPISNVKMAIHMLKNAPTEEKRQQYLKILEAESQREADLIDDLLDLQKLEVSAYPIAAKTLQIQPWLESITQRFQSRLESHKQVLTVQCSQSCRALRTDFNILERVISELLNNACKYTPSGHQVEVEVRHGEDPASTATLSHPPVVFKVSNQAEIADEELPQIFNKFYRIPHADPWKQGGTGLGLALVEKLVEQIQGKIDVISENGWTHFTLSVPHNSED